MKDYIPENIKNELQEQIKDDPYGLSVESFFKTISNTLELNKHLPRHMDLCEMVAMNYNIPISLVQKIYKYQNS